MYNFVNKKLHKNHKQTNSTVNEIRNKQKFDLSMKETV